MSFRRVLWLLLGISLGLAVPGLVVRIASGQSALNTLAACLEKPAGLPVMPQSGEEGSLWFSAWLHHCRGEKEQEMETWQRYIETTSQRLEIVAAAYPAERALAELASQRYPSEPDAQFWYGDILLQEGDGEGAMAAFERGVAADPENGLSWRKLGTLYEQQGNFEKAVEAYDQACFLADEGKNGCPNAGRLYMQSEQYEIAIDRFHRSLNQLPGYLPIIRSLADALIRSGKESEARSYLEILAKHQDSWAADMLRNLP